MSEDTINRSLIESIKKRADNVENWIPGTQVVPLEEILWELNQHKWGLINQLKCIGERKENPLVDVAIDLIISKITKE